MPLQSSICAIVPTYNRSGLLRTCIDSLLNQSRPLDDILVVNDGSTDDTEQVVRSYGNQVRLITKKNGGKAAALNLAFEQTSSDYLWICDDDDYAAPDGAEHLAAALDANENIGFAFGTFRIFTEENGQRTFLPPTYWRREEEPNVLLNFLEEMFTFQFAMMVRRTLYQQVGPFSEEMIRSQDHQMALRLAARSKAHYVPEVIFFQRRHMGQRGSAAQSFSEKKIIQKWLEYDQKIFSRVKETLPLKDFTPTFALSWDKERAARAALLQRACVLAQRGLWKDAISDFRDIAASHSTPATAEEVRLAEKVIRNPLAWDALGESRQNMAELHQCFRTGGYSRAIMNAICRPLLWQAHGFLRSGNLRGTASRLRMLVAILGLKGAGRRVYSSVFQ